LTGRLNTSEGYALARQAIDVMAEQGVAPTPTNYAVFTSYVADSAPALCEAIQTRIDHGEPIDQDLLDDLYDQHFALKRVQEAVLETGGAMSRELGAVMETLEAAGRDTAAYGDALAGATGVLEQAREDDNGIRRMVEGLVSATARMQRRSRDLEKRLAQTSSEVELLRDNLEKVREEAMTDALTGVANRKRFDESLRRARRTAELKGEEFCLLLCDIDHFKRFNDTWGHQTGDQIIRFVSACLSRFSADHHVVARYGGEEFGVVMPATKIDQALELAEKIRQTVESKRLLRKSTSEDLGHITVSFGVSQYRTGESVEALIERCDSHLYASKAAGRNRVTSDLNEGEAAA
jgi:diguanylate cyclase